jgi:hypothetical protein
LNRRPNLIKKLNSIKKIKHQFKRFAKVKKLAIKIKEDKINVEE